MGKDNVRYEEMTFEELIKKCLDTLLISSQVKSTDEEPIGIADTFLGTEEGRYRMYPSVMGFINYIRRYRGKRSGIFSRKVPHDLNLINSLMDLPEFHTVRGERNKFRHILRRISMDKFRLACFVAFSALERIIVEYIIYLDDTGIDTDGRAKKPININGRLIGRGRHIPGLNDKITLLKQIDNSDLSTQIQNLQDKGIIHRIVTTHRNALMHTGNVLDWEVFNILLLIYLLFLHDKSAPFKDCVTEEDDMI